MHDGGRVGQPAAGRRGALGGRRPVDRIPEMSAEGVWRGRTEVRRALRLCFCWRLAPLRARWGDQRFDETSGERNDVEVVTPCVASRCEPSPVTEVGGGA
jgi:hypothetical protein